MQNPSFSRPVTSGSAGAGTISFEAAKGLKKWREFGVVILWFHVRGLRYEMYESSNLCSEHCKEPFSFRQIAPKTVCKLQIHRTHLWPSVPF